MFRLYCAAAPGTGRGGRHPTPPRPPGPLAVEAALFHFGPSTSPAPTWKDPIVTPGNPRCGDWPSPSAASPAALHGSAPRALVQDSLHCGAFELAAADADLDEVLSRLGVPPMWGKRPGFASLVQIILEQQVSLAAAHTMYRRLHTHLDGVTPAKVQTLQEKGLRDLGFTGQKARYCHGLAVRLLSGDLDLGAVARADDPQGRQALLEVPGLGPWSVDIYYVMALRRPDVWPRGDLALAAAMRDIKHLDHLPGTEEQLLVAGTWAPWRSIAARFLWAHYLNARGQYPG